MRGGLLGLLHNSILQDIGDSLLGLVIGTLTL